MTTVDLDATQTHDESSTHDEPSCAAHSGGATRRHALLGVAVAVGAVCAGCSSSKSNSAAADSTSSTATSAGGSTSSDSSAAGSTSSSSAASGTSSSSSSDSGSGAAVLAATSAVPVGGGTILTAQKIVLTQPTAGTYKAFTAVCTHMGCVVGTVENGLIVCPCHGSQYHIADGSVANGPAPAPLASIAIKVDGGKIEKA